VSTGSNTIAVPDVKGRGQRAAEDILRNAGFSVSTTFDTVTNPGDVGKVISQDPPVGTQRAAGSTVTIVIGQLPGGGTTTTTEP